MSWYVDKQHQHESSHLLLSRCEWIRTASVRTTSDLHDVLMHFINSDRPTIIRGADANIARIFLENGGSTFQTGIEAAIDLDDPGWNRPSLRELSRRALRFGSIRRYDAPPFPNLPDLRRRSVYARRPPLRGVYLTDPDHWQHAWEFCVGEQTVGLVTVSRRGELDYHAEVLMRARTAPKGTMEALILAAASDLKFVGARELSLGECPFVIGRPPDVHIHLYGILMARAYHARGLYRFKAKFQPRWRPVYLCGQMPLFLPLVDLFFQSGSASLFLRTLFSPAI